MIAAQQCIDNSVRIWSHIETISIAFLVVTSITIVVYLLLKD